MHPSPPFPPVNKKRILCRMFQVTARNQTTSRVNVSHAASHQLAGRDIDLCIQSHSHHSNAVTSVLFAGRFIVTGSLDGTMTLINFAFSEIIDRLTVPVKCGGITCISAPLSSESASTTFIAGTESGRLAKVSFTDSTVRCCALFCRRSV